METEPRPGLFARLFRPLMFPIEADFTTPLSLEQCSDFLVEPVPSPKWFFLKNRIITIIEQEIDSLPDEAQESVIHFSGSSKVGEVGLFISSITGVIEVEKTGGCRVRYTTSLISLGLMLFIFLLGLIYLVAAVSSLYPFGIADFLWLPGSLAELPSFFGCCFVMLLPVEYCILPFLFTTGSLKVRREILQYLDDGLHRPQSD